MLIRTRWPGESVIIETPAGEQITVTVLEVNGNQVRIGTGPQEVMIATSEELL